MTKETIAINVTLGSKHTFHLRLIGLTEETELKQKIVGLTDKQIEETEYERNVNLLSDLSEKMPEGLFPNAPKEPIENDETVYVESFATPRAAVEAFFKEKTTRTERIAYYAAHGYFVGITPAVDF
jgi:hypothetical protein